MAIITGDTIVEYINTGHAADSWTVLSAIRPSGAFTPTITEVASGVYKVEIVTTEAGAWFLSIEGAASGQWDSSYDVDATVPTGGGVVSVAGGTTLRSIRRRLMRRLGDGFTATATAATDGQTFTDTNNLTLGNDKYNGRAAYTATGANAGIQRVVSASDFTTGTLTFRPAFPNPFAVGDEVDLMKERGMGWTVAEYHGAINDAIEEAAPMGGVPITALLDDPFAYGEVVAIPEAFETIDAVSYEDAQGFWIPVAPAHDAYASGWSVSVDSEELAIKAASGCLANGRAVRLVGTGTPGRLTDDDDATGVNIEWLEARCLEMLLDSGVRNDPERSPLLNKAAQKARLLKRQAVPIRRGDAMWVRSSR